MLVYCYLMYILHTSNRNISLHCFINEMFRFLSKRFLVLDDIQRVNGLSQANVILSEYIALKTTANAVLLRRNLETFFASQLWWATWVLGMLLLKILKGCINSKSSLFIEFFHISMS